MLPILRILPVGGVLLAIFILVLALIPPDGSRAPLPSPNASARGALIDRDRRPEVRQFLIHAALKRADELNRLRDLPDTPTRTADDAQTKSASLPGEPTDTDPEESSSINETPAVSIPIEVGEPSSAELPVTSPPEIVPVVKKAEQAKPQRDPRRRVHRARYSRAVASMPQPRQPNLFDFLFGVYQQPAYGALQAEQQPYPQAAYSAQSPGRRNPQPSNPGAQASHYYTVPRTPPY